MSSVGLSAIEPKTEKMCSILIFLFNVYEKILLLISIFIEGLMSTIGLTNTGTKQEQLVIDAWGIHPTRKIDGNACIKEISREFPNNNVADVA